MTTSQGKLIVIEGLEGAGKSTAMQTVLDVLSKKGITAITTREPGGTPIGEALRSIIKNPEYSESLEDKTELLLLYSARIQLIEQVIKPALKQGHWVVADRFELSTIAYQGGGRGLDMHFIQSLSEFCLNGFSPDLILYLDIPPELGMQRVRTRGAFDRIEQQSMDFFQRVHLAYLNHIKQQSNVVFIDASQLIEHVQALIQQAMLQFIEM
jgi:dTMP kinase